VHEGVALLGGQLLRHRWQPVGARAQPPDASRRFRTLARVGARERTVAATGVANFEAGNAGSPGRLGRAGRRSRALVLGKTTVLQKCCDGNNRINNDQNSWSV